MEFTKHFGRYRSLWAELEMLRPSTIDPAVLNERREQDKVFGLLLTLNPVYNDLIKHLLRSDVLPSLDDVCSQIQREQGSQGLFGGKGELHMANQGSYNRYDNRRNGGPSRYLNPHLKCDHCKKEGHTKDKCWLLHPHLRTPRGTNPNYHKGSRANYVSAKQDQEGTGSSKQGEEANQADYVRKTDLEALIKSIVSLKESGKTFYTRKPSDSLVVDSGASHHMISNLNLLEKLEPSKGNVMIANGDNIPIKGIGNLNLFNKRSKAFYMPNFESNLLSVKRMTSDLNCYAIFGPNDFHFQDIESGKVIGGGGTKDDLYVLEDLSPSSSSSFRFQTCLGVANNAIWHARVGHPHSRALEIMLPNVSFDHLSCESCILGKHCKSVFTKSSTIYENCFDLVHSDVWTSPCASRDNNKYFVTFIDEKSKYTWLTLLPSKDRVFDAFVNFQTYITNQYNAKIKIFRTDNGGEYMSNRFKDHLAKLGILHQTTCPYTPQQNGVAERKNRHLMEVSRAMMFHMNVPRRFWGDAVMTACYLINRTPTKVLGDLSPFEVLTKEKPFLNHLKVFGCVCFVLVPRELRDKLEAKSTRCIFLGYSTTQKGYKCYDPSSRKTFVSRDVKFLEEQGFYGVKDRGDLSDLATPSDLGSNLRFLLQNLGNHEPRDKMNHQGRKLVVQEEEVQEPVRENEVQELIQEEVGHDEASVNLEEDHEVNEEVVASPDNGTPEEEVQDKIEEPVLRRSTRLRKDPSQWKESRVYYNNEAVAHPIQAVCSLALLPSSHRAFVVKIDEHTIPKTYEEAMEDEKWVEAVDDEVGAMIKNQTWDETDLPEGKRAVSSKWVFTIKYLSNGDLERYKARLVARGFTQTYGDDYTDTFAPVAKLNTVRVVFSLAANLEWDLWQMDVKNAFLQGDLEEEVYMTPPPGLEHSITPGKVLKLKKAIYGLKQSPRAWYKKLSTTLKEKGFKKCELDHTLFTLQGPDGIVVVLIYVDDMIISGSDKQGIQATKDYLRSVFEMKDLGELKYFLGIEVCRFKNGLHISQRKYTMDLLKETGKLGAKPAKTPLEDGYKGIRKGEKDNEPYEDPSRYRRLVGKLIYLTLTRPDISFAVNQISQHMKEPTVYHWHMVERILRYLKESPGLGVWMGKNESSDVVGYCDADWAGDRNDRRSTTGYCTFIGGNLVTWRTKKQKEVSCSSAEAEYRAMKKLTNELTWLRGILAHLGIETEKPMIMHCDNQAAIHIATNSVFHERTKHIEIDCHKVREKIEQGWTLPCFTRSEDQLADVFTKSASLKVCNNILGRLGLVDLTHP